MRRFILIILAVTAVGQAIPAIATARSAPAAVTRLCQSDRLFCHGHWTTLGGAPVYKIDAPVVISGGKVHAASSTGVQVMYSHNWGCMSSGGQTAGGSIVKLYGCNGSRNQLWNLYANGFFAGSSWMLQSWGNGMCINNRQGSDAQGNVQNMWPCDSTASWMQYVVYITNHYGGMMFNSSSGTSAGGDGVVPDHTDDCISTGGSRTSGTDILQYTCTYSSPNQAFGK